MKFAEIIHNIERNASFMAKKWAKGMAESDFTVTYKKLPQDQLAKLGGDVYNNLGHWMEKESFDKEVETIYARIGRERYAQGYPLSEIIFALHYTKKVLSDFITSQGLLPNVIELYQTISFLDKIYKFFDYAAFYLVKGYNEALFDKLSKLKCIKESDLQKVLPPINYEQMKSAEVTKINKFLQGFNIFKLK